MSFFGVIPRDWNRRNFFGTMPQMTILKAFTPMRSLDALLTFKNDVLINYWRVIAANSS
jgi:hypothetical protein